MNNNFSFVQYYESIGFPDGIYNGKYNGEAALIRIKDSVPVWVQFIGFIKHYEGEDKVCSSSIYNPKGILHSSVELLLPAQKLEEILLSDQ